MRAYLLCGILFVLTACFQGTNQDIKHGKTNFEPVYGASEDLNREANLSLRNYMNDEGRVDRNLTPDQWQKMRWVSKSLILLRGGKGLGSEDDLQYFLDNTKDKIVDDLVNGEAFFETLVKFNFYYMGLTLSDVYLPDGSAFNYPVVNNNPAFNAAANFMMGKNYFEFFSGNPKYPVQQSSSAYYSDEQGNVYQGDEALAIIEELVKEKIKKMTTELSQMQDPVDMEAYCQNTSFGNASLYNLGLNIDFNFIQKPMNDLSAGCNLFNQQLPPQQIPVAELIKRWDDFSVVFDRLLAYAHKRKNVVVGTDYRKIDYIDIDQLIPGTRNHFFRGVAFDLSNSSTNFNRKRAAYVLDRFLCDDLLPLDVELPEEHQGGVHGSEPSCYACHYRLDPMAGFFKDYGAGFGYYKGREKIIFDDLAEMDKAEYDLTWMNPVGSKRKWNIGVVRSEKDETKNHYGEDLDDLFPILEKMPEVKKCMTKRVFEYANGKYQNVDQGFLAELTDEFIQTSQTQPNESVKQLFKRVALSQTFQEIDPIANECYDYPKGHNPNNAPPCQVNFILQNKCAKCHYPFGGEKGLDLTTWVKLEGDRYGFVHEPNGSQLTLDESFTRIAESLTTPDPKKRMPYKQHMDPSDRETLYLWVNQQMTGGR